jgi:hypothetical protein
MLSELAGVKTTEIEKAALIKRLEQLAAEALSRAPRKPGLRHIYIRTVADQ